MTHKQVHISQALQLSIDNLNWLSEQIHDLIDGRVFPAHTLTDRKRLSLATLASVAEYSISIALLCGNYKSKPAEALQRALLEGWITLCYVFDAPDDSRYLLLAIKGAGGYERAATDFADYLEGRPELQKIISVQEWRDVASINHNRVIEYKDILLKLKDEAFIKTGFPNVPTLAKLNDQAAQDASEESDQYLTYSLMFSYLSGSTHLGLDVLNGYYEEAHGIELNGKETDESNTRTAQASFKLAARLTVLCLREVDIDTTGLESDIVARSF